MTMYRVFLTFIVSNHPYAIDAHEVRSASARFLTLASGERQQRQSSTHVWFDTREEAVAYVRERVTRDLEHRRKNVERLEKRQAEL